MPNPVLYQSPSRGTCSCVRAAAERAHFTQSDKCRKILSSAINHARSLAPLRSIPPTWRILNSPPAPPLLMLQSFEIEVAREGGTEHLRPLIRNFHQAVIRRQRSTSRGLRKEEGLSPSQFRRADKGRTRTEAAVQSPRGGGTQPAAAAPILSRNPSLTTAADDDRPTDRPTDCTRRNRRPSDRPGPRSERL